MSRPVQLCNHLTLVPSRPCVECTKAPKRPTNNLPACGCRGWCSDYPCTCCPACPRREQRDDGGAGA